MRFSGRRIPTIRQSHPIGRIPGTGRGFVRGLLAVLSALTLLVLPAGAAASSSAGSSLGATLQPLVVARMKELRVPGAVVYVQAPDKGTWKAALGTGNLATNALMRFDDHFRIGSITKTFTATVSFCNWSMRASSSSMIRC